MTTTDQLSQLLRAGPRYGSPDRFAEVTLPTRQDSVTGRMKLLGFASSRLPGHNHDRDDETVQHCAACRWFEVHILRTDEGDFIVHTCGMSIIIGERQLPRIERVTSAFEVIEILTYRKRGQAPYLPVPAARALAQAAQVDDDICEAYVNRAVA